MRCIMDISLRGISKNYGRKNVLNNINLTISTGVFGLLGENGAGKTTLMKIIATLLESDVGNIYIEGKQVDSYSFRRYLGYVPQNFDFFHSITVYDAMDYIAELKKVDKKCRRVEIMRLLGEVHLEEKLHDTISRLSGGMKQRLGIAQALLGNPPILIMDEPTVGLDPMERLNFRNIIMRYSQEKIVILSSHIISDISMLCGRLAIMSDGRILYVGDTNELIRKVDGKICHLEVGSEKEVPDDLAERIITISRTANNLIIRYYQEDGIDFRGENIQPTLEDAYFYIMARKKDEEIS